jgi:hypothetical protein
MADPTCFHRDGLTATTRNPMWSARRSGSNCTRHAERGVERRAVRPDGRAGPGLKLRH